MEILALTLIFAAFLGMVIDVAIHMNPNRKDGKPALMIANLIVMGVGLVILYL